jgi:CRISPR-associated protein Cas5t
MIRLEIQAPFAACRPMIAGWYRPTAGFLTHSAVYGLVLNLAGIEFESRLGEHEPGHGGTVPASLTRPGLPAFRLALGLPEGGREPAVGTIFQQLHNYPVGKDAGIDPALAQGRKNNITPVRRELLCGVHSVVVVEADTAFEASVRSGIEGSRNAGRYGLPFLGDNNYTLDRLELIEPRPARWYTLAGGRSERPRPGTTRLTTYIDRASMAGTRSALFVPQAEPTIEPPDAARVPVGDRDRFDAWLREHQPR